jgi:hypothetical protein
VKEVAMTRQVRLWITAVVIMASAALTAALTTAAHASEERSQGTGHSSQAAVNQPYTLAHLADEFNKVGGGPVFSRLVG